MADPLAPLAGVGVLVTRPEPSAGRLARVVREAGGRACRFPVIALAPVDPAPALAALDSLREGDWLVPVSPGAVRALTDLLAERKRPLPRLNLAAVGEGTARALQDAGWRTVIRPTAGEGAAALLATPSFAPARGQQVFICRGEGGRRVLDEGLDERGIPYREVVLYRRVRPDTDPASLQQWLLEEVLDVVVVSSVTAVDHLLEQTPATARPALRGLAVVAPSERVLQQAARQGFHGPRLLAEGAGDAALVAAIEAWWQATGHPDD